MKALELNPERFKFPTINSALKELQQKPKTVFVSELSRIEYFYKKNYNVPGFKVIKEKKIENVGFIFPKYSPLKPLFFQNGLNFFDSGAYDKLAFRWIGIGIPSSNESHPVISLVHTLACFVFLVIIMVLCVMVLGAECMVNKFYKKKQFSQKFCTLRQMKENIKENSNLNQIENYSYDELKRKLQDMTDKNTDLQQNIQILKSGLLKQNKSNIL